MWCLWFESMPDDIQRDEWFFIALQCGCKSLLSTKLYCAITDLMLTVYLTLSLLLRVRRQLMLQVLVEFQCKAVNTQQTVTITDDIHVVGVLHATTSKTTRTVRVGKRTKEQRTYQKVKPSNAVPIAGGGTHLTICVGPTGVDHNIPTLPCRER